MARNTWKFPPVRITWGRTLVALTTLLLTLCSGCKSPPSHVTERKVILDAPYDLVWDELVRQFGPLYPFERLDKFNGVAETKQMECGEEIYEYAYPSHVFFSNWSVSRASAAFRLDRLSESRTAVSINCRFYRYDNHGTHAWHAWQSNGTLEQQLMASLSSRVRDLIAVSQ